MNNNNYLFKSTIETPLGTMIAIANDNLLYLLEFADRKHLDRQLDRLQKATQATFIDGISSPLHSIALELNHYFKGSLQEFKTPLYLYGSPFQQSVWHELQNIPYGKTHSYVEIAQRLGNPGAQRAIARANSTNHLALIIPCHRVINAKGTLSGYAGGIDKKQWLLEHETRFRNKNS